MTLKESDGDLRSFVSRMMRVPSFNRNMKSLMGESFERHHAEDPSKTKVEDLRCAMELLGFIKELGGYRHERTSPVCRRYLFGS